MMLIELVVVIMVVWSTYNIARQFSNSDSIKKAYYAEDMAMMVDTMVAMPGDGVAAYPNDVSNFVFSLNNQEVQVFVKGEEQKEVLWERRSIHLPEKASLAGAEASTYSAAGFAKDAQKVCVSKKSAGNDVLIKLEPCANG